MEKKFRVCAVVVCYYPNMEEFPLNIDSIASQVDQLLIVDNSEIPLKMDFINGKEYQDKIEFILLGENKGIGAAQNIGIQKAIDLGFDGVLLLDQDSNPPQNLVEELSRGFQYLNSLEIKVACLGPEIYNKESEAVYTPLLNKGVSLTTDFVEKDAIISSGKLLISDAVQQIGLMDETLFIDLVDFEWCWRARKFGYRVFTNKKARMGHMVGQKNKKLFNVYNLLIPSPIRHYYQFRNSLLLLRKGYVPKYWKVRVLIERTIDLFVYPFFINPKRIRFKYIRKGIMDGVLGRKGKIAND
ncbi:glycosyltransferase family 2 protein [Neobacillus sp.]|uniref:glycosyltransferase family 2 protein n=1 Tax=Neobacillus sp. TaxID=2675273 RepID=UPI00289A9AA1|nr:glycosyltransferase family 2 protein [Neobacillus sp.]